MVTRYRGRQTNNPFFQRHQTLRRRDAPQGPPRGAGRPIVGEVLSPTTPDPWAFPEASGRRYGARSIMGGSSFEAVGGYSRPIVDRPSPRSEVRRYAREAERAWLRRVVQDAVREASEYLPPIAALEPRDLGRAARTVARSGAFLARAASFGRAELVSLLAEMAIRQLLVWLRRPVVGFKADLAPLGPGWRLVSTWDGKYRNVVGTTKGVDKPANFYQEGTSAAVIPSLATVARQGLRQAASASKPFGTPTTAGATQLMTGYRPTPSFVNWYIRSYWFRGTPGVTNLRRGALTRGYNVPASDPLGLTGGLPRAEADPFGRPPVPPSLPPYRRRVVLPPSGHRYRPRQGQERKANIRNRGFMSRLLRFGESITEVQDFIDNIYEALPRSIKQSESMKRGKRWDPVREEWVYRQPNHAEKVAIIVEHFRDVDLREAIGNIAMNEVEDRVEAKLGELSKHVYSQTGQLTGTDRAVNLGRGAMFDLPRF